MAKDAKGRVAAKKSAGKRSGKANRRPAAKAGSGKPSGLQKEPARIADDGGSLPASGKITTGPASLMQGEPLPKVGTPRMPKPGEHKHAPVDEATISRLGKAELRAIGLQRGYEMPENGTRAMRAAFSAAQSKDKSVAKKSGGKAPIKV